MYQRSKGTDCLSETLTHSPSERAGLHDKWHAALRGAAAYNVSGLSAS